MMRQPSIGTGRRGARILALASATVLLAAATLPTIATAQGDTFEVIIDGHTPENGSTFLAFFPSQIEAHPGDTIEFPLWDSGEPHTVTLGSIIDEGMAAAAAAMEAGTDPFTDPAVQKVPVLLTAEPGDANQVAANPCFVADEGAMPADACNDAAQPAFDGTQAFYNSGWLGPEAVFTVPLSDDIAAGTYTFVCLLHGPQMAGTITVVDEATEVASPAEVSEQGQAELEDAVAKIQVGIEAAGGSPDDQPFAGVFVEDVMNGFGIVFAPEDVTVGVGDAVTWTVLGPHTISFNAPQDAVHPRVEAPDGTTHINPAVFMPSNSPGQTPPEGEPDPNAPPAVIDAGEWDGTGYLSSGAVFGEPPVPAQYRVTFTESGTYAYQCLIHPDMKGTVTVVA